MCVCVCVSVYVKYEYVWKFRSLHHRNVNCPPLFDSYPQPVVHICVYFFSDRNSQM